jgi:hypothetical protein
MSENSCSDKLKLLALLPDFIIISILLFGVMVLRLHDLSSDTVRTSVNICYFISGYNPETLSHLPEQLTFPKISSTKGFRNNKSICC